MEYILCLPSLNIICVNQIKKLIKLHPKATCMQHIMGTNVNRKSNYSVKLESKEKNKIKHVHWRGTKLVIWSQKTNINQIMKRKKRERRDVSSP